MPDDHCPAMPQLTAVDGQFGTHQVAMCLKRVLALRDVDDLFGLFIVSV